MSIRSSLLLSESFERKLELCHESMMQTIIVFIYYFGVAQSN
jgi:hypothetical protein